MVQTIKKPVLLMVDDDNEDIYLTRRAFSNSLNDLQFNSVNSGSQLFDYLHVRGEFTQREDCPIPDIILLDINIPKEDGFDILQKLRADEKFAYIPVSMLTTSSAQHDVRQAYETGANSFVCKSVSVQDMQEIADQFCRYWFNYAKLPAAA